MFCDDFSGLADPFCGAKGLPATRTSERPRLVELVAVRRRSDTPSPSVPEFVVNASASAPGMIAGRCGEWRKITGEF
jgi:hypothetical protein